MKIGKNLNLLSDYGRTIKSPIYIEGKGVHSGEKSRIIIHPSDKRGIFFLIDGIVIPALHDYVVNTRGSTDLGKEGELIKTVEHFMAVLYILGIDSLIVEFIEGYEMPIFDGGAFTYFNLLIENGFIELPHKKKRLKLTKEISFFFNGSFFTAKPCKYSSFSTEVLFNFDDGNSYRKKVSWKEGEIEEKLIRARTFVLESEIEIALQQGLGKGANPHNTAVLESTLSQIKYIEEPAYHKLLDLIGDISLLGGFLEAKIFTFRGGHTLNHAIREFLKSFIIPIMP